MERFDEPVSSCAWAADSRSFFTGTFDLSKSICQWSIGGERIANWGAKHRVEDLVASPDQRLLVAMDDQSHIYVYHLATRELEMQIKLQSRPLSISISQDSLHLLINKVNGDAQLVDLVTKEAIQKYAGFTGGECIIRSGFGGANESFVVSGSDGKLASALSLNTRVRMVSLTDVQMALFLYGTRAPAYWSRS